jgi:hypothetical protein
MADFDDLKLDKSAAPPPPPQPRWIPIVAIAVLLFAFVAIWLYFRSAGDVASSNPVQAERSQAAALRETAPTSGEVLPPLDESDAMVRDLLRTLSQHPVIASLLTTDQLIRTFAVSIHNLAEGQTPAPHLHAIPPGSPLLVQRIDPSTPLGAGPSTALGTGPSTALGAGGTIIDRRSYARFDRHAAAIDSIDAAGAARLYTRLKPRLEEAYREVGGPSANFDRAFERAVAQVLRTPVLDGPIAVRQAVTGYAYAEPALESLPRAQQQLLRMGPENVRIVQAKVRAIAREIGISEENLPAPRGSQQ